MSRPMMRLAGESSKALPRKLKFTVKALARILPPSDPKGRVWVYDAEKRGLALLVTGNGARSFYLNRRIHGKPSRVRLGGQEMTIQQAKAEVDRLNGEIIGGVDPSEIKRQERRMKTTARSQLLSRTEAAAYLGLSVPTLEAWASRGTPALPYCKVGHLAKYRLADLEEFISSRCGTSATAISAQLANA